MIDMECFDFARRPDARYLDAVTLQRGNTFGILQHFIRRDAMESALYILLLIATVAQRDDQHAGRF